VSFLSGTVHLVDAPWQPNCTRFAARVSSSPLRISLCTSVRLDCRCSVPSPCRPVLVVPTMSMCLSLFCAVSTALVTDHFRPVLSSIPAPLILSSGESFNVNSNRALATLNASTNDDTGSWSFPDVVYRPVAVKLGGSPNHWRRNLLMTVSFNAARIHRACIWVNILNTVSVLH